MYYVTKTNSKGQPLYQVVEKYKDPLTVSYIIHNT